MIISSSQEADINTIYYELEAVTDLDLRGERNRLWKDKSGDFPLRISNFENKFQA